ncbi:MAG: hypothetical protein HY755_03540 [Nitrospirae bacterium]|nr:hypothetical protein [Nitrospirota bacterium]
MRVLSTVLFLLFFLTACSTAYKATPLAFKTPGAYSNAQEVAGAMVGAKAYIDSNEAVEAFGFDIRGAGMLPVQIVFDNNGKHFLEINASQTFLEDKDGNLWPILSSDIAYERATKYAQTKQIFKEGAYHGFLGAVAGAAIGAAIGIVSGENVIATAGKGAAIGGAGGAVIGGASGYESGEARRTIISDLKQKSLQTKSIEPKGLSYGFIFFPGEAKSAKQLRIQIREKDTGALHVLQMSL